MARAFLVVLDSLGIGGAPDAAAFGDAGANTLGHIAEAAAKGLAEEGRSGPLHVPHLERMGLGAALHLSSGMRVAGLTGPSEGSWGVGEERSRGKDTPSGHWELAGVPVPWDWTYFPQEDPAFSLDLMGDVAELAGAGGTLGNVHASGVPIIETYGARHMMTGWPICYTSADSVFQIAAHEDSFGLARLLQLCEDIAPQLHAMKVGRVIARPFKGSPETGFQRTANRRDYAMSPPSPTLLEWCQSAGRRTYGIGKISDIFSGRGIDVSLTGTDDMALMDHLIAQMTTAEDGSLTFANFVEFDSLYGHRRDVSGYARALERWDARLPEVTARMRAGDLLIITADHGNDPTWPGTDHTRERVPVLVWGRGAESGKGNGALGVRGFADVAASIAAHLDVEGQGPGRRFL